jgi:16S rRNA G1207 methylase RsmC
VIKMIVTNRPLRYATRRLKPGEDFIAKSDKDAKVLVAVKRAEYASPQNKVSAPPAKLARRIEKAVKAAPSAGEDPKAEVRALRDELHGLTGKNVFSGWDADTLRAKIAAARG